MKFYTNLYLQELTAHKKGLIGWSIGMILMVAGGMSKYQGYKQAGESVNDFMAGMPEGVLAVFGGGQLDLTQAVWFYALIFLYLLIMGAIHSAMLGAELIAKEERDNTCEFLYVNPISRTDIITAKLLAGVTNLVVLNLVTLVSSLLIVEAFNDGDSVTNQIFLMMIGLFFVQIIFLSIGMASAAVVKKPKLVSPIATGFMLSTFFLSMYIKIKGDYEWLQYFTPFHYFDGETIVKDNALNPTFIVLSIGIIIFMFSFTYFVFNKRDLNT
ncbi:MAG: ABC transporter permease subunit [bacterium]|nr:ABC transporter permease subunit [bacterium]